MAGYAESMRYEVSWCLDNTVLSGFISQKEKTKGTLSVVSVDFNVGSHFDDNFEIFKITFWLVKNKNNNM